MNKLWQRIKLKICRHDWYYDNYRTCRALKRVCRYCGREQWLMYGTWHTIDNP